MDEKEFKELLGECQSTDEIRKITKENNLSLSEEEIDSLFNEISKSKPMDDEELKDVTGGYNRGDPATWRDCYRWNDTAYDQPTLRVGDRVSFHWHPFYRKAYVTKIVGKGYTGYNGYQWKYEVSFEEYNFFSANSNRVGEFFDYELLLNNDGRQW